MPYSMYDEEGNRKYTNWRERRRFIRAARPEGYCSVFWSQVGLRRDKADVSRDRQWSAYTFCLTLIHTGARISEVLALTPRNIDVDGRLIVFRTLKQRGHVTHRPVPVPAPFIRELNRVHKIKEAKRDPRQTDVRIWPWSRTTAWSRVKEVMKKADIDGIQATPKGLRHGYAVEALVSGITEATVMRLLGHRRIETTLVYTAVVGAEARAIASRMWMWRFRLRLR